MNFFVYFLFRTPWQKVSRRKIFLERVAKTKKILKMFAQKLILIGLILFEFTVEKCSVQRLIANHTLASNSSKIGKSLNGSNIVNGSNAVNVSSIRNESTTRTVHLKPNKIPPRLQEQDESDDNEDYEDNEGIDGLDEEGAGQEEGNFRSIISNFRMA